MTPQRQQDVANEESEQDFEKVNEAAATLYLEMNRCIKVGNLKAFREAIAVTKEIVKRNDL